MYPCGGPTTSGQPFTRFVLPFPSPKPEGGRQKLQHYCGDGLAVFRHSSSAGGNSPGGTCRRSPGGCCWPRRRSPPFRHGFALAAVEHRVTALPCEATANAALRTASMTRLPTAELARRGTAKATNGHRKGKSICGRPGCVGRATLQPPIWAEATLSPPSRRFDLLGVCTAQGKVM